MKRIEHNALTNSVQEIDLTPEEVKQWETDNAAYAAHAAAVEAQAVARASALAKLAELGLTDDEIAALVG